MSMSLVSKDASGKIRSVDDTTGYPVQLTGSNLDFYPRGKVLFEDDFHDGLQGWTWLMGGNVPVPGPVWNSRRTMRNTGSMLLETGNVGFSDSSNAGNATAIKRLTLPRREDGTYYDLVESEYWYGFSSDNFNSPASIQFGLDTQRPEVTGYRNYFKVRFHNYDDATTTRTMQFQINTPSGYVGVGPQLSYANEAKAGFFQVRFRVNITKGYYDTIWIDGQKFDVSAYECTHDGYVSDSGGGFDNGMNFSIDLQNRSSSANDMWAKLWIPYARGVIV